MFKFYMFLIINKPKVISFDVLSTWSSGQKDRYELDDLVPLDLYLIESKATLNTWLVGCNRMVICGRFEQPNLFFRDGRKLRAEVIFRFL